jgi:hypothetical protein
MSCPGFRSGAGKYRRPSARQESIEGKYA